MTYLLVGVGAFIGGVVITGIGLYGYVICKFYKDW